MKNLYKVQLEYTIMVLSENEDEAEREAMHNVREEEPDLRLAEVIENKKDLPREWFGCYPYGGECDQTCEELLS